jgi:hypothetical protein
MALFRLSQLGCQTAQLAAIDTCKQTKMSLLTQYTRHNRFGGFHDLYFSDFHFIGYEPALIRRTHRGGVDRGQQQQGPFAIVFR